jgi:transcription-repair coupling factor (superfamily II helicase)
MRAAFVAVSGGRQVAVLVPTTLLAQQHYHTFANRFADWPVKVESLSRFQNPKETKAVMDGLANGTVDIVVGTHKLLQGSKPSRPARPRSWTARWTTAPRST